MIFALYFLSSLIPSFLQYILPSHKENMPLGEIFLTAFINLVFQKLASPEFINFACRLGVHSAIKKWAKMLMAIREVLDDAEEKQITNQAVKSWLDNLQDLAYDVDDMLDEFNTEAQRHKLIDEPETSTSKVRSLIPTCCTSTSFSPSSFAFEFNIGSNIDEINSRLENICEQRMKLGLERVPAGTPKIRTSTCLVNEPCVYGRDEDEAKLIELLLKDESKGDKFCVIPIVGMAGVGKTTLAQIVFNNEIVKEHFNVKAWVCVSDEYDIMKITKSILEAVTFHPCDFQDLNQVQVKLKQTLAGKRFLLILDDVWNKKYNDWQFLQSPFREGLEGSKIIVTTRDRDVASMMATETDGYHYLEHLSNASCWLVFKQHAFGNKSIEFLDSHPILVEIGHKIVEKCKGLPLAARTLGGLLRSKVEECEWEHILNSNIWELSDAKSDILPVLRLSYHHLPLNLKRCFSYCSILPKDYEFSEKEIILLWLAEGLLEQQEEDKQMEDLGHEYFYDLVSISFFQSSSSDRSLFVMHDLINELAQWAAGGICSRLENKSKGDKHGKISKKVRHSSYIRGQYDGVKRFEAFKEAECLRTFLPLMPPKYGDCYLTKYVTEDLLLKLRCLRVLSLSGYYITKLPDSIGKLKHLRYIDLSGTSIISLPESTCTLYNLQTLKLKKCSHLKMLPTKIRDLINLRHLDFTGVDSVKEMPSQIGRLTSLQTLSNFVVSKGSQSGITELRKLLQLRGALSVSRLENVNNALEAQKANLNDKLGLDVLELNWSSDLDNNLRAAKTETDVLDMLQPHKKLKELTIKCYGGTGFPTWIGDKSFCNMVLIRLEYCARCTSLPQLGQLPMLKDLCIRRMDSVITVGLEFYGVGCPKLFPSLETLRFEFMEEWEKWEPCGVDRQVEVFPCLRELSILTCPKLSGQLPGHLPSLENLIINGCSQLVVSISSLPKLCKLDIKECKEVVQRNEIVDHNSLKSMVLSNISNLMCLTKGFVQGLTTVEDLEIGGCKELTSLWQKEVELLQHLTSLHHLKIKGCPKFVSLVTEELEEQEQLGVNCKLESLELYGCGNLEKLHGLQCLTSLTKLTIIGCPRFVSFPETGLPSVLKELTIRDCSVLKSVPMAMMHCRQYESLEHLCIGRCESLKSIARGQLPTTLKKLEVLFCKNLRSLVDEEEGSATMATTSSDNRSASLLEDLSISWCGSLTAVSSRGKLPTTLKSLHVEGCPMIEAVAERLHNNTSLEKITIRNCKSLKSLGEGLQNLTQLSSISIWKCPSLVSFPDGGLPTTNLRDVVIENCEALKALPNGLLELTSVQKLTIGSCPGIVSFSKEEGFPTNLTCLEIRDLIFCKPLFEWRLHRLTSLRQLTIGGGCLDLVSFPANEMGIILPSSLTSLSIREFQNLECLSSKGFEELTSLQELYINNCPRLKSFPEIPSLLQLYIIDCPLLKQRCKKDQGRDWQKIAYIPQVQIIANDPC